MSGLSAHELARLLELRAGYLRDGYRGQASGQGSYGIEYVNGFEAAVEFAEGMIRYVEATERRGLDDAEQIDQAREGLSRAQAPGLQQAEVGPDQQRRPDARSSEQDGPQGRGDQA